MPRQSGDQLAVAARRVEVARLYCRGWPQHKLGARFGVSQVQISHDLAAVRKEWQRVMVGEFDRLKAEQLAKIDALEAEAWRGWRRSLKDAEKTATEKVTDPDGDRLKASRTVEGQAGDPRFLQVIDSCIDRRLKLIGGYPKEEPAAAAVVVIQKFAPGLSPADLLGGRHERDSEPSAN